MNTYEYRLIGKMLPTKGENRLAAAWVRTPLFVQ